MAFVRSSKFRHIFGSAYKADACFNGLKTEGTGDTNCSVNCTFFAMIKSQKIFIVPLDKPGRQEENNMPYLDCKSKVLDVAWSPFNDYVLASSEEGGDIHIWYIPEGGLTETISAPAMTLNEHTRKVSCLQWHPVAEDIIAASGYDSFVTVWNCEGPEEPIQVIPCGEFPTNIAWNKDGSKLAITTKENKAMSLIIVDPRTGDVIARREACHEGAKATKCFFLNNGNVCTIGADRQANRSILMWDKDLKEELCEAEISNSSSVVNPYYDGDLGVLYVFGKGESTVKYYEINEKTNEIFYLSAYSSTMSQKGGNFMPKRGVSTQGPEIARFYKLQPAKCEPVSFIVPRKSDHFQSDIYPPCASDEPGLTAQQWLAGENKDPILKAFEDDSASRKGGAKKAPSKARKPPPSKSSGGGAVSATASASNGVPEGIDFAELLEDMKKVKATVRKLNKRVSKLEEMLEQQNDGQGAQEEEEEEEEE